MKKYLAMAAIAMAASTFAMKADAMPIGPRLGQAADGLGAVEQVQYFYGGRRYCFYPDGWRGPGFYWCGYNLRQGLGWGGPIGFRGWSGGGGRGFRGGGIRREFGGGGGRAFRGGGGGGQRTMGGRSGGQRMGTGGGGGQRMGGGGGGGNRGGMRGGGGGGGKKN